MSTEKPPRQDPSVVDAALDGPAARSMFPNRHGRRSSRKKTGCASKPEKAAARRGKLLDAFSRPDAEALARQLTSGVHSMAAMADRLVESLTPKERAILEKRGLVDANGKRVPAEPPRSHAFEAPCPSCGELECFDTCQGYGRPESTGLVVKAVEAQRVLKRSMRADGTCAECARLEIAGLKAAQDFADFLRPLLANYAGYTYSEILEWDRRSKPYDERLKTTRRELRAHLARTGHVLE